MNIEKEKGTETSQRKSLSSPRKSSPLLKSSPRKSSPLLKSPQLLKSPSSPSSKSPLPQRKSSSHFSKSPSSRKSPSSPSSSSSPSSPSLRKSPSSPPVFSYDIYMNQQASKIQQLIKSKFIISKNTLKNRINLYKLLTTRLSLLKDGDCLEEKKFNGTNGYTIRNIINLEKQIGSESKNGKIYLTNIPNLTSAYPNLISVYPIATKIMGYNNSNIREVGIMHNITMKIVSNKFSRHFLMIYSSSHCSQKLPVIPSKSKYISVNELADGDLKMLFSIRDILEDDELILNILFQTYISIATFQNIIGYFHNDTHNGNFLYHYNNERGYYHYVFNGKDYYLKSCKYNIIIFDFGSANHVYDEQDITNIQYDYARILNAFSRKGAGWGVFNDLPTDKTTKIIKDISSIIYDLYEKTYQKPFEHFFFSDIIEQIFLRYTPKGMFITERPSKVLNDVPFVIGEII